MDVVVIVACLCTPIGFALGVLFMRARQELRALRAEYLSVVERERAAHPLATLEAPRHASPTTMHGANGAAATH